MNATFFDSSSFVKLFVAETGSPELIDFVTRSEDRSRFVSVLAPLEVRSAIRRREAMGDIRPQDARQALHSLSEEMRRLVEHPISEQILSEAAALVDRHSLRALDAIQLASALLAKLTLRLQDSLTFVASDQRLLEAALKEGLATWDPSVVQA